MDLSSNVAPPVRLELTTSKLTASCSTIELQGNLGKIIAHGTEECNTIILTHECYNKISYPRREVT